MRKPKMFKKKTTLQDIRRKILNISQIFILAGMITNALPLSGASGSIKAQEQNQAGWYLLDGMSGKLKMKTFKYDKIQKKMDIHPKKDRISIKNEHKIQKRMK